MLLNYFDKFRGLIRGRNEEEKTVFNTVIWDNIYYSFLSNICCGIFNFEKLTKDEENLLVKSVFKFNFIACYRTSENVLIFCGATPVGSPNEYGIYNKYILNLTNEQKSVNYTDENVVICNINTIVGVTYNDLCWEFSNLLTETKKSILNSIILSRCTKIFEVENENDVEDIVTTINSTLEIGKPYTIRKGAFTNSLNVVNCPVEDTNKYFDVIREILNEFLTITGLSSLVAPNKKERLITDEVSSNNDIKGTILKRQLDNLLHFCDEIKEKFNKEIYVTINENIEEITEENIKGVLNNDN